MMKARPKVLLVEDDVNLGFLVQENLQANGYEVCLCVNGEKGKKAFFNDRFDICILDVMMPLKDGFSLAKEIREADNHMPIVFLTSKASEKDRLEGFLIGADDYVTKPFSLKELILRIQAILKRSAKEFETESKPEEVYSVGLFRFYPASRLLTFGNEGKTLSIKESVLLHIFIENKNAMLNRSLIMNKVWGNDDFFVAKSMDVYITRLRKLLKDDANIEIQNLYGTGFKFIIRE